MRAFALGLLLAVAQVHCTRAQQQACAAGAYWDASASACSDCAPGFYQPLAGETACTACPEGMNTSAPGARLLEQCTCPPGTGLGGSDDDPGCSACAPGLYAPGTSLAFDPVFNYSVFRSIGVGTCLSRTGVPYNLYKSLGSEDLCRSACYEHTACIAYVYFSDQHDPPLATRCYLYFSFAVPEYDSWTAWGSHVRIFEVDSTNLYSGVECYVKQAHSECTACPAGKFQGGYGQTQCASCAVGTYQAHKGRANCTGCPESMNTSAPGARSVVQCTCPPGTGLGVEGYGGGCSACAPGSYAPDAGPAFEFVGEGSCTGTCAHAQTGDSEGGCALECVSRGGCVGFAYTHASSVCELHWAQPRATEVGWTTIGPATACAGINGSTGGEGQACWRKDAAHPQTQLANLLHPPIFELVGDGFCRSANKRPVWFIYNNNVYNSSICRRLCELDPECTGYMHAIAGDYQNRCYRHYEDQQQRSADGTSSSPNIDFDISQSTGADIGQCFRLHDQPAYTNLGQGYCRSALDTRPYYHYVDEFTELRCRRSCNVQDACIGYMFAESGSRIGRCYVYYSFQQNPLDGWRSLPGSAFDVKMTTNTEEGYCYKRNRRPALACIACAPGSYQPAEAQAACAECGSTGYAPARGHRRCVECLPTRQSAYSGAVSKQTCLCAPGYASAADGTCESCDSGQYSALGVHSYELEGSGHCGSHLDRNGRRFEVNARFAGNITESECQAECNRQSSCVGYTFSTHRQPGDDTHWHKRCWVHGQGLAHGLLDWQTAPPVPGAWRAYAFAHLVISGVFSVADEGDATWCYQRAPLAQERTCRVCRHGGSAPLGAVEVSECTCEAGYARANATSACALCSSGTYSPGNVTGACIRCPDPTRRTSPAGSTSALNCTCINTETETLENGMCVCQAGYTRANATSACTLCPSGTYSPGNATGGCITCPDPTRQTSPAGSTSALNCTCINTETETLYDGVCVCLPGHGRASNTSNCTQCPSGTYSPGNVTSACTACPENTTSPAGSTARTQCYCANANETRDLNLGTCVCAPGFGRESTGAPCTRCPVDSYDGNSSTDDCTPCALGLTSPEGSTGADSCTCAGANAQLDASSQQCVCLPGHGRANATSACLPCAKGTFSGANGTFSVANGSNACLACPLGATSPPLSTSVGNCSCQPGYGRAEASANCSECRAGTYGPSGGDERCELCPATLSSPAGSAGVEACGCSVSPDTSGTSACVCPAGYGFDSARRCIKCLVGSYGPSVQAGRCDVCPPNMTTLVDDARSIVDCVCLPGHGMTAAGYEGGCTPCAAGNFQPGEHVNFEYLGTGHCTSTCANWREMADEGECALVCAGRVDCIGYSHGTPVDSNVSRCILYFRDERNICDGWEPVGTDGQCAVLNASGGVKSMSCRRKNFAAPAFGFTSLDHVPLYENIGTGHCIGIGGQLVYSFAEYVDDLLACERECTRLNECIGFHVDLTSWNTCYLYMLFVRDNTKLYNWFDAFVFNRCGHIENAYGGDYGGHCMRKKKRAPLSCIACDTGTVQVYKGQSACDACSSTSFSSKRGSQTCESCPVHTENLDILAQSVSACRCSPGFYANDQQVCTTCPDEMYSLYNPSFFEAQTNNSHLFCISFVIEAAANRNADQFQGVAVQVAVNVSMAACERECERYSACIGYQYVLQLSSTNISTSHCTLFPNVSNVVLAGTFPVQGNAIDEYEGWAIVVSSEGSQYFTPIDGTVLQEHCYTRKLGYRTCHDCPLGGRAPPGSGSEAACVLTRALPAGLNASAWRALGAGVLTTSTNTVTLDVLRYDKHEISMHDAASARLFFNQAGGPYTCVNITVGSGPLEAQAADHDIVFATSSTGILASFSATEPYARVTATICGIPNADSIMVSCQHTALDAEFNLTFYVGNASAPPSASVTPLGTPDREARPHVHAHGHNVSLWGVGGPRGVTVLHDYTHDLVYTFARNLTRASVGAVHRNSTAASADSRFGLWLSAHDVSGDYIEYVHNEARETVQALRLPLPANASVHMLAPDPSNTWVLCVLHRGTELLVLDVHTQQRRQVVGLQPTQYVHAVFAHSVSYIYVAYTSGPPPAVTDGTSAKWVRYRLDMQQYMVQVQLPVAAAYPPALCPPGSSRDPNVGVCVVCERGSYKNWTGDEGCLPCGPGETTRELGADARVECSCKRGFGRPDSNTACEPCAAVEFKHRIGDERCTACLDAQALASGGDGVLCACASGLYFDAVRADPVCVECPRNTYKEDNGTGLCTACGAHMHTRNTASTNASDCLCDAGHGLGAVGDADNTTNACSACEPGSYMAGGTRAGCAMCEAGTYAVHSMQSACASCPDGFYASGPGARECEPCVFPNASTADRSACAPVPEPATDACANKTRVPLAEYVRLQREDLGLKTLAELEHSPGGLPETEA